MRSTTVAVGLGLLTLGMLVTAGCRRAEPPPATQASEQGLEQARVRAERASQKLIQTLGGELQAALQTGPPDEALGVCAERAQSLTRELGAELDLEIRRTALRLRNPLNAPDSWERDVMQQWLDAGQPPQPVSEVVGEDAERRLRYMQPIVLLPPCASCHGSHAEIPQPVRERLDELYPDDQARDFEAGQLRGAVSVSVKL